MIDNLRMLSDDPFLLSRAWTTLLQLTSWVGITIGEIHPPALCQAQPYTYLGMLFGKDVRPAEKIRIKLARFRDLLLNSTGENVEAVDISAGFGVCIFASQCINLGLADQYYIIKFFRRVAHQAHKRGWSFARPIWNSIVVDWLSWIDTLMTASFTYAAFRYDSRIFRLFTDASDHGWGVVILFEGRMLSFGQPWSDAERRLHINIRELLAHRIGLHIILNLFEDPELPPIVVDALIDNTTALGWATHRRSRCYVANGLCAEIETEFRGRLTVRTLEYVRSEDNLADAPSRPKLH
jgi:hypothetical protein